ncbi:MAG TPA: hypothetical protein VM911_21200 [Pyrinomonadaceae bacterium]|jgi:hypothetical protein|nr:hypothetical protein [Pyrinomonadaceae bacterium]
MAGARKCEGEWRIELTFDVSNKREKGRMTIGPEDGDGNFDGEHVDEGNSTKKKLRKGKCKSNKIHFERDHKDGGEIVHDGDVTGDREMSGTFSIDEAVSRRDSKDYGSKQGGKDKEKVKKKDAGDTGTWTGVKEGL